MAATSLVNQMECGNYEHRYPLGHAIFYRLERDICHAIMRRRPPRVPGPQLLNLGCGPHLYPGWINADDYSLKRRIREPAFRPNWSLDISRRWKCENDHWDGIFSQHVIEHLSYSEAIAVLKECLRTLKPGAWLRVSVPDVMKFAQHDSANPISPGAPEFSSRALAISFATQMHLHRSAWDDSLLTRVLSELGYTEVRKASYGVGAEPRLVRDDPDKERESLFVDARK
jgi:predicted SAM-dependent methyltransferase